MVVINNNYPHAVPVMSGQMEILSQAKAVENHWPMEVVAYEKKKGGWINALYTISNP